MPNYKTVDSDWLEEGLTTVCDSIREKTGGTDQLEFPLGMKAAVDSIPQGGECLDLFPYVRYVDFTDALQEVTEDIVLHLERAPSLNTTFSLVKVINAPKITVYIGDACTNMSAFARGTTGKVEGLKTVEIVGNTGNIANFDFAFYWRVSLEEVVCEFDFSSAMSIGSMLAYCTALRKFKIKPNTLSLSLSVAQSPDLTDDTIQSIVDAYADMTGQTSPVLTLHPDVKEKLTDTQKATLTSKNVTIA